MDNHCLSYFFSQYLLYSLNNPHNTMFSGTKRDPSLLLILQFQCLEQFYLPKNFKCVEWFDFQRNKNKWLLHYDAYENPSM